MHPLPPVDTSWVWIKARVREIKNGRGYIAEVKLGIIKEVISLRTALTVKTAIFDQETTKIAGIIIAYSGRRRFFWWPEEETD